MRLLVLAKHNTLLKTVITWNLPSTNETDGTKPSIFVLHVTLIPSGDSLMIALHIFESKTKKDKFFSATMETCLLSYSALQEIFAQAMKVG